MHESYRAAPAAGVEPKCSSSRDGLPAPDLVEVSPLMRSCIFGFNTHVAELPSSATDVKGAASPFLGPCKARLASEVAVRRELSSQLPEDLLRSSVSNDSTDDNGSRSNVSSRESGSEALLAAAPSWARGGSRWTEDECVLPPELSARLAELSHEVIAFQGETKDPQITRRSAACKKGRQVTRRLTAGLRLESTCGGLPHDIREIDGSHNAAPLFVNTPPDYASPIRTQLGNNDVTKDSRSTSEQDDSYEAGRSLRQALSLELTKLEEGGVGEVRYLPACDPCLLGSPASPSNCAEGSCDSSLHLTDVVLPLEISDANKDTTESAGSFVCGATFALPHASTNSFELLEDVIEPTRSCVSFLEKHANGHAASHSALRPPLDAGGVFAEVQMTLLALLEDLHSATCCCAAASSPESCGCCVGASPLLNSKQANNASLSVMTKNAKSAGKMETGRDSTGELIQPATTSETAPLQCGKDRSSPRSFSPAVYRSCRSPVSTVGEPDPAQEGIRASPDGSASAGGKAIGIVSIGREERDPRLSPNPSGIVIDADSAGGPLASAPPGPGTLEGPRHTMKKEDGLSPSRSFETGDVLHLLFRHHSVVMMCADRFAELLPYSHIFRECVGSYRMPTTMPSSARHLLVQELLMLRQDPDRFLTRNAFLWTEDPGALACLAAPKGALDSDRVPRGEDGGPVLPPQSPGGGRKEGLPLVHGEGSLSAVSSALTTAGLSSGRSGAAWAPPLPLLDPTVLLCASGTELVAQKSAVLRILRILRSLAPSWAARDDNFGFHFKTAISATSLDCSELRSYRVVLQSLSPFDAREWSRDQLMEVLSDLDCIRLACRRRRSLKSSVARVQRLIEHPEGGAVGKSWNGAERGAVPRQLWELSSGAIPSSSDSGNSLCPPRQALRGGRDPADGQLTAGNGGLTGSVNACGSTVLSARPQSHCSGGELNGSLQQATFQQLSPAATLGKAASRPGAAAGVRLNEREEMVSYPDSDVESQALGGGGASVPPGMATPAGSSRRGQSPTSSSIGARRNAWGSDAFGATANGKTGNSSPSDCPMRQQYAVRAAELPKIKGVFIGKKHTCWVAQWNDANGQPRQSCFNIKQHGFEKARRLAVQARQTLMGMSTSKTVNPVPAETHRTAAQPVQPAPPSPPASREVPPSPTRLPDLLFMRDPATAIAEAFGGRSIQTPTAILQHQTVNTKLDALAAATEGPAIQREYNGAASVAGSNNLRSLSPQQTKGLAAGTQTARNSPRGASQRPTGAGVPSSVTTAGAAVRNSTVEKHLAGSAYLGLVDGSTSAMALVNSLLESATAAPARVPSLSDLVHGNSRDVPRAPLIPLRPPEGQHQQAASPTSLAHVGERLLPIQGPQSSRGGLGTLELPEEGNVPPSTPFGPAETLDDDGHAGCTKRSNRLLCAQKAGKRTLASLAREFPTVGGVTYNVKGACWEVAVKGREATKVFSTRKFGGLEAAYGAAVMWKRRVERGEAGADDGDMPDGDGLADDEDLDDAEGPGREPPSAPWEAGLDDNEPLSKRIACFRSNVFVGSLGAPTQQQQPSLAMTSRPLHAAGAPVGKPPVQQPLSRATSV
ncbi:hypothetical protein cyc_01344 [Cyclospora cayetanensis]|uniref:Uncharacterized protein n=1 Tax=Cyclospora cayetanensis TaxID=88456 RepID=A0A1D3D1E6_9EIME|nr:hypothetical protein cyc_01344 [Cyclospora cayetanensis]